MSISCKISSDELSLHSFKNLPETWSYYIRLFTFFLGSFDEQSTLFQLDHQMIRIECCINIFRLLIGNQINMIYNHIGSYPSKIVIDSSSILYYPRGRSVASIDEALEKSVVLHNNTKNEFLYIYDPEVELSERWFTLLYNVSNILVNPYIHGLIIVSIFVVVYKIIHLGRSLFRFFM